MYDPHQPGQGQGAGAGAYIRNLTPSAPAQTRDRDDLTWGSEVELPQAGDNVSPPKPSAPTIHIQAPTDSNVGKSQRTYATQSARGPVRVEYEVIEETIEQELPTALPEPTERDLPPTPAESIRSNRPSPAPTSTNLPIRQGSYTQMSMPPKAPTMYGNQATYRTTYEQIPRQPGTTTMSVDMPDSGTGYKTAVQHPHYYHEEPKLAPVAPLGRPLSVHGEEEQDGPGQDDAFVVEGPRPWDRIMQRLFSWAVVWEEGMFTRAMEDISLNKQVSMRLMSRAVAEYVLGGGVCVDHICDDDFQEVSCAIYVNLDLS
jgi:hypothetical protein